MGVFRGLPNSDINSISKDFKEKCLDYDLDIEHELIITCLNNNHDFNMISQLNLVTYAGPLLAGIESICAY